MSVFTGLYTYLSDLYRQLLLLHVYFDSKTLFERDEDNKVVPEVCLLLILG